MRKMTLTQEIQETSLGKSTSGPDLSLFELLSTGQPGVVGTQCPRSSGRAGLGDDGTPEALAGGASGMAALWWCPQLAREPLLAADSCGPTFPCLSRQEREMRAELASPCDRVLAAWNPRRWAEVSAGLCSPTTGELKALNLCCPEWGTPYSGYGVTESGWELLWGGWMWGWSWSGVSLLHRLRVDGMMCGSLPFMDSWLHLPIPSFTQQMFIELLLCARPTLYRCLGCGSERDVVPSLPQIIWATFCSFWHICQDLKLSSLQSWVPWEHYCHSHLMDGQTEAERG